MAGIFFNSFSTKAQYNINTQMKWLLIEVVITMQLAKTGSGMQ